MDTASVAHPYALPDAEAPLPYRRNRCVYLFSVDSPISSITRDFVNRAALIIFL